MTFPDRHYQAVRKKHQCFGCNKIIAKGSPAWYSVGVWEGDFYYYHMCDRCKEITDSLPNETFEDGLDQGFINEINENYKTK